MTIQTNIADTDLRTRAKFVDDLIDLIPVEVAVRDAEGRYTLVNRAWEKTANMAREQVLGKTARELFPAPRAEAIENTDQEALALSGRTWYGDMRVPVTDQSYRYLGVSKTAMLDGEGRAVAVLSAATDLTGRREVEAALKQEQQRLSLVIRASQSGILDWDVGAQVIYYSERLKEMLGYSADADTSDWAGLIELVHPDDYERVKRSFVSYLRAGRGGGRESMHRTSEYRLRRADGTYIWVATRALSQRDESGRVTRYIASITDITEAKQHEEESRDQEKLTRDLIEYSPIPIYLKDPQRRFVLVNAAFVHHSGVPLGETIGRTALDIIPTERSRRYDDQDRDLLERGEGASAIETEVPRADGVHYYVMNKTVLKRADGSIRGLLGTVTEVTAIKRAQAELREQGKLMRDLIDANPNAIYLKDSQCRYVEVNAAWSALSRIPAQRAVGRTLQELVPGPISERTDVADRALLARGEGSIALESQVTGPDGKPRWLMVHKAVLRRSDGSIMGIVGTSTDITPLKRIEDELRASREEALQAAQAKAAFLATMSHEIRTPLNGVIGMTGVLLDSGLTPEQLDYVETIRVSGETLLSVINDILDFSKIESGKLELEREPLELARVIEEGFDILGERARAKRLELLYQLDDDVPSHVYGDSTCLRQIIVNLAGNALKFTDAGEVLVAVRRLPAGDGSTMIEFRVSDTGIGIPTERLHVLFQPFTQVDASTTRKYGGTGLGLAICKRLTERMGGTIAAESEPGRGSTFVFTIRCDPAPAPVATDATSALADLSGKRVLIVDDNASNLRILEHQLGRWGMLARAAADGRSALGLLAGGEAFDAAIVDYQMPDMNGVSLAQAITQHPACRSLPLILLSSSAHQHAKDGGLFAAQLLKPTRHSQLFDALIGVLTGRRVASRVAAPARAAVTNLERGSPLRVLVVDDNEVNRRIALLLLKRLGYHADTAADGRQAVAAVERKQYDVVFMDVQMPEMDGYEATREIGKRLGAERPVIVAMTANAMEGDREECLAAGMDDYVSKPLEEADLGVVFERWCRRGGEDSRAEAPADGQAGPAGDAPVMDWARLAQMGEYDDEDGSMVRKIVGSFVRDGRLRIAALGTSAERGDAAGLVSAAHALRGAALNVGAIALAEVCAGVEGSAREGHIEDIAASVALLRRRFRDTARLLRQNVRRKRGGGAGPGANTR